MWGAATMENRASYLYSQFSAAKGINGEVKFVEWEAGLYNPAAVRAEAQ